MPKKDKPLTIYDLAKLTDASPSTVGAVLNGSWKKRRISTRLAEKILKIADEEGYTPNLQAKALRKEKSGIIGMILPMYDNRYFSSIAELFESRAREIGLFPIVTCTHRNPDLELDAARAMLNYRVDHIICAGATDPDGVAELCIPKGVTSINIDLPGSKAVSIISDNFKGAVDLTNGIIDKLDGLKKNTNSNILFIGGEAYDHNTKERIRGFKKAHSQKRLSINKDYILPCGYEATKAEKEFDNFLQLTGDLPDGIFVNSTISLEGIIHWFYENGIDKMDKVAIGCFDWDPFAALVLKDSIMVKQDVPAMIDLLFKILNKKTPCKQNIYELIPEMFRT